MDAELPSASMLLSQRIFVSCSKQVLLLTQICQGFMEQNQPDFSVVINALVVLDHIDAKYLRLKHLRRTLYAINTESENGRAGARARRRLIRSQ
jgi:hypothetical protein